MRRRPDRHKLFVDGEDTLHTTCHILMANGIATDAKSRSFDVEVEGRLEKLLDLIVLQLKIPTQQSVGFIVDAESSVTGRWVGIAHRLSQFGLQLPAENERSNGVVVESRGRRIGFWVMPDNRTDGAVEEFLNHLINPKDQLWPHANSATDEAARIERRFQPVHRRKAVLTTWLAWQEHPGRPYGTAIKAGFLNAKAPIAISFVQWFRRLCGE